MRILAFFMALAMGAAAYADISDEKFLNSRFSGMMKLESRLSRVEEVVTLAEALAAQKGIRVQRLTQKSESGHVYSALEIMIEGNSSQNLEAKRVASEMAGLPLVFSPFDLSFGAEAYFLPDGSHLGVPFEFFTDGPTDPSYRHELQHADTQKRLIFGENPLWGGAARVVQGKSGSRYLTNKSTSGYASLASLDEILTTALSIKLEAEELAEMKRNLPTAEFNRFWGPARPRLSSISHSLELGRDLAKQTADLAERSLANLNSVSISETQLTIGSRTESVYQAVFTLSAYEYSSGVVLSEVPNATHFTLYSDAKPTLETLRTRLELILEKSRVSEAQFVAAYATIKHGLEHVEIEKSDIDQLTKIAGAPHERLAERVSGLTCRELFRPSR